LVLGKTQASGPNLSQIQLQALRKFRRVHTPNESLALKQNPAQFAKEIEELKQLQCLTEGTKDDKNTEGTKDDKNNDGAKQPQPEKEHTLSGGVVIEDKSQHSSSPVTTDEKEDTPIRSNTEPASSA
jgi:hypothetical protein